VLTLACKVSKNVSVSVSEDLSLVSGHKIKGLSLILVSGENHGWSCLGLKVRSLGLQSLVYIPVVSMNTLRLLIAVRFLALLFVYTVPPNELKKHSVVLKEDSIYQVRILFYVQREIVQGLKYTQRTYKAGIRGTELYVALSIRCH